MADEVSFPVWPPSLPVQPLIDAYNETVPILTSNVTTGNKSIIVRKNSSRIQTFMSVSFNFNKEQMDLFEEFYSQTLSGGANIFTFTHPRKKVTLEVSFSPRQETAYTVAPNGSMEFFKVSAEFMIWN